jgi:hypothetical protein
MTNVSGQPNNGRTIAEILNDFKEELKQFSQTRFEMLRSEMKEKLSAWKGAVPAIAIAAMMALGAFGAFTAALIAALALAFEPRPWAYAASAAIVFLLYTIIGVAAGAYGYRSITTAGMAPEKTLRVLQEDKVWLTTEARSQV